MKKRPPEIERAVLSGNNSSLLSYYGRIGGKNSRKKTPARKQEIKWVVREHPIQLNLVENPTYSD